MAGIGLRPIVLNALNRPIKRPAFSAAVSSTDKQTDKKADKPVLEVPQKKPQWHYDEIFKRIKPEGGTPEQQEAIQTIIEMTSATGVQNWKQYQKLLANPNYPYLAEADNRMPFQTPFADLLVDAKETGWAKHKTKLIKRLVKQIQEAPDLLTRKNAIEALVDCYFYAIHPGGVFDIQIYKNKSNINLNRLKYLTLKGFRTLMEDPSQPIDIKQHLSETLRNRWMETQVWMSMMQRFKHALVVKKNQYHDLSEQTGSSSTQEAQAIGEQMAQIAKEYEGLRKYLDRLYYLDLNAFDLDNFKDEVMPLIHKMLPKKPETSFTQQKMYQLESALSNPSDKRLRQMSRNGELTEVIPEWSRVSGPWNTQHKTQSYTLEEHILKVVEKTKASSYFMQLSGHEKRLVLLAAILHDTGKKSGPHNCVEIITPDKAHPIKSADIAIDLMNRLPSELGLSDDDKEQVVRLVLYHQALGNMNMAYSADMGYPEGATDEAIQQASVWIRHPRTLAMLMALTEGDIRSVRANDAFFTQEVKNNLEKYRQKIEAQLAKMSSTQPHLPHLEVSSLVQAAFPNNRRAHWKGQAVQSKEQFYQVLQNPNNTGVYTVDGQYRALRISLKDFSGPRLFMTLGHYMRRNAMGDGFYEHTPYRLDYGLGESVASGQTERPGQIGLLVDVAPENIAAAYPGHYWFKFENLDKGYARLFEQLLSPPKKKYEWFELQLGQLHQKKLEIALSQESGLGSLSNKEPASGNRNPHLTTDKDLSLIANLWFDKAAGKTVSVLAIHPRVQAVYVIQRGNKPVELTQEARWLIDNHHLPLIMVSVP